MPPRAPQPQRYAIQKARGKGWTTLEVGEALPQAEARFALMTTVNPKAYFRLIQLDHDAAADYGGTEFTWRLIRLHDPSKGGGGAPRAAGRAGRPTAATARRRYRTETVGVPLRVYLAVVLIGLLGGGLAYLRWGLSG